MPKHFALIFFLFTAVNVFAAVTEYAFSEIPSRFHTHQLTAGSRALGELCYSRYTMPDGTVCSPSLLSYTEENSLLLQMYLGNGYGALSTADNFVNKTLTKEFLEQLFRQNNSTSVDANAGLVFTAKYFSASFQPYRVQYASEVHNPNFPVIAVHAAKERSLGLKGGVPLSWVDTRLEKWTLGLSINAFERKFLHGSFSLFQALTEDANQFLPIKEQSGVHFEPALSYKEDASLWNLLGTLSVSHLGPTWGEDPAYPNHQDLNLGLGISPEIGFGKWSLGVDFVNLISGEGFMDRFRIGTSYALGAMEVMTGWNRDYLAVGLQYRISIIQAAIVYEFMTHEYGGLSGGSKIATEISVRL